MIVLNDRGLVYQVVIIKSLFKDEKDERTEADKVLDDKIDDVVKDLETSIQTISDTYATKQEVSLIPKFAIEVVQTLPTQDISDTTVYLVPSDGKDGNMYTEHVYVKGKWEELGSQSFNLTGYATEEWVNNVLQNYVTNSALDSKVEEINNSIATKADASSVYTKTETDTKLNAKANAADVYTKEQSDNSFAKKDSVYTKTEMDSKLGAKADSSSVYTKTEADKKFATKTELHSKADKSDTYTKDEVDTVIENALGNIDVDDSHPTDPNAHIYRLQWVGYDVEEPPEEMIEGALWYQVEADKIIPDSVNYSGLVENISGSSGTIYDYMDGFYTNRQVDYIQRRGFLTPIPFSTEEGREYLLQFAIKCGFNYTYNWGSQTQVATWNGYDAVYLITEGEQDPAINNFKTNLRNSYEISIGQRLSHNEKSTIQSHFKTILGFRVADIKIGGVSLLNDFSQNTLKNIFDNVLYSASQDGTSVEIEFIPEE